MTQQLKLMGVFAHPDDESMGTGGAFAKYADEGVETYLRPHTYEGLPRSRGFWHFPLRFPSQGSSSECCQLMRETCSMLVQKDWA